MVFQGTSTPNNDVENPMQGAITPTGSNDHEDTISKEDTMSVVSSVCSESTPLLAKMGNLPPEITQRGHGSLHSLQSGLDAIYPLPGMKIRSHCIGRNGGLTECTEEEALTGANANHSTSENHTPKRKGKKPPKPQYYWMDIDADPTHDADELRAWLSTLHLPNFVIETLSEAPETWASQVMPLERACLAVLRILPEHYTNDDQQQIMAHLAALSLRNILITFTSCPRTVGNLYDPVRERMQQPQRLPSPTSQGAMIAWLRFHLDRTSRATRELRYAVLTMDEAMDRDLTSVKLEELIAAKDQVLLLLSVAEEQVECVESLLAMTTNMTNPNMAANRSSWFGDRNNGGGDQNGNGNNSNHQSKVGSGLDFSSVQGSLASLVATAGATERMALRLEKHIVDLRDRAEQHEHSLMNRRLGVLTVLSAIFLPLTLLTGIWGMNFTEMPELQKPYAYPLALLFMVTLALSMIHYFRKGGWLD